MEKKRPRFGRRMKWYELQKEMRWGSDGYAIDSGAGLPCAENLGFSKMVSYTFPTKGKKRLVVKPSRNLRAEKPFLCPFPSVCFRLSGK